MPPKSTTAISLLPSASQSHSAAVPEASPSSWIGKPGSMAPVAPLSAARLPFSSPITTSLRPSPSRSATTGLAWVAPLTSAEKRAVPQGARKAPL